MQIMKIKLFDAIITKIHEIIRISFENHYNHENSIIIYEHHENKENLKISFDTN